MQVHLHAELLLALVGLGALPWAEAKTYHVSATAVADADSGPGSAAAPWRTLARASQQAFQNGDELLLRCGEVFRGQLDLRVAAGAGALRIAGYGDCGVGSRPRLDGSAEIETTSRDGRRVANLDQEPGRVLVDGRVLPRAFSLHQVVGTSGDGWLRPALPAGAALQRGTVYLRTRDWLVEQRVLAGGRTPETLASAVPQYPVAPGTALAITGKAWVLGRDNWVYDAELGQLLIAAPGGRVRVAPRRPLLRVQGAGSVQIEGLALDFAGDSAIHLTLSGSATLQSVDIVAPAGRGIDVVAVDSLSLVDSRLRGSGADALTIGKANRVDMRRNRIEDVALFEPLQPSVGAIDVARAGVANLQQNQVLRAAYVGIRFGPGAEVRGNLVQDSCLRLSDCAAIYTWQRMPARDRPAATVAGNLVLGVTGDASVKLGYRVWAAGIYLDDNTSNVSVVDNLVVGSRQGVYLHNAFMNRVENNAVIAASDSGLAVHVDAWPLPGANTLQNRVAGNHIEPALDAMAIRTVLDTRGRQIGTWKDNVLITTTPERQLEALVNTAASGAAPRFARDAQAGDEVTSGTRRAAARQPVAKAAASPSFTVELAAQRLVVRMPSRRFVYQAASAAPEAGCTRLLALERGPLEALASTSLLDCPE